ncbi:DsbA family protein [Marinospirillum insulare]|uniref:Thioredoxin-like fold domain-containing protein n=1 Tax=Marinospirillum insulare TaxID=217169 RepID=A0ABQ6A1E9_9GAMM|nr:hypothetical protein [Marinospirillum insulare]GLR63929.1 hypothetical protein GCM10007878_13670 [Marinospirillum insulare]
MSSRLAYHILMFFFLSLTSYSNLGATDLSKPTLVVLVDINCNFCRELHGVDQEINYLAEKAGINLVYAPIPNDADVSTAWAEKTYYACYKDSVCDSRKLLDVLYAAQDFNRLDAQEDVDMWLDMKYSGTSMHKYLNEAYKYDDSVKRMINLAAVVRIKQFPTFVVVGDRDLTPYQIASNLDGSLSQRVNTVQNWLKNRGKP